MMNCKGVNSAFEVTVYETSESGNALKKVNEFSTSENKVEIHLNPEEKFQTITGFGGSFTEASAHLLNKLSKENRKKILDAYFSESGANYSLTRTTIASCDFSLKNYTYAKVEHDLTLEHFTIEDDKDDIIPMILEAKAISKEGMSVMSPLIQIIFSNREEFFLCSNTRRTCSKLFSSRYNAFTASFFCSNSTNK